MNRIIGILFAFVAICALAAAPVQANVTTASFTSMDTNSSAPASSVQWVQDNVFLDVIGEAGVAEILFKLRVANVSLDGASPSVKSISFYGGVLLLDSLALYDTDDPVDWPWGEDPARPSGVDFKTSNTTLPGYTPTLWSWESITKDGAEDNGVGPGEWLGVSFDLQPGTDYQHVVSGLSDGRIVVGIHVSSLEGGESEWFVAGPSVPAPGALLLGSIGCAVVGWLRRRKTL